MENDFNGSGKLGREKNRLSKKRNYRNTWIFSGDREFEAACFFGRELHHKIAECSLTDCLGRPLGRGLPEGGRDVAAGPLGRGCARGASCMTPKMAGKWVWTDADDIKQESNHPSFFERIGVNIILIFYDKNIWCPTSDYEITSNRIFLQGKSPSKNLIVLHMTQISSIKVFGLLEIYILLKNAGGYLEI